ncbi:MAG: FkbM family methyltransferase [Tannerella sp.]|jgi:FkbM family methyltransferase|nr:FkbM family methyltransferase [Tannerella sp.]
MNNHVKISVLTSLYRCREFLEGYFKHLSEINGTDEIEVLLLHNDPQEDETEIINRWLPKVPFARHIIIPERESLYSSWNRGIRLAQGEYITVWNVDDVRFPDSILQQAEALDKNPQAAMAYGDIWISDKYGVQRTKKTNSPIDNRLNHKKFLSGYYVSCFQMWRKSIHEIIGYYDEQFKCSADFDFQIRAALHFSFVKTEEPLGIYLEGQPHKLSANGMQELENNIIYLRYGVYDKINLFMLGVSKKKYRKDEILQFGKWKPPVDKCYVNGFNKTLGIIIALNKQMLQINLQNMKVVFKLFKGKKKFQALFKFLLRISLSGLNYGGGTNFQNSGELWLLKYLQKQKDKNSTKLVLFDVGGNQGKYAMEMANIFGQKASVFSFEPSVDTYKMLLETVKSIDTIHPFNFGFSNKEQSLSLYTNEKDSGIAPVYKRNLDYFYTKMYESETIHLSTIDKFCKENEIDSIYFLKLDVEGHELSVLQGAKQMIVNGKIDYIQIEFGGCNIDSRTYFQDFYYFLKDKYHLYRILRDGIDEIPLYDESLEIFLTFNFLAIKK